MNRITNSFILVLFIPIMALTIFVAFDLPLGIFKTTGSQLPYRQELMLGLSILVAILFINRSVKRCMGLYTVAQKSRFVFRSALSSERKKRVVVYGILESFVYGFLSYSLWTLTPEALPSALVFLFFSIEGFVFVSLGSKYFATGLSSKAIIVADREVVVVYYNGLRKVSIGQQTLYFDYIQSLQLSFPIDVIPSDQRQAFVANLETVVDDKKVLIHNLGSWKK